MDQRRAYVVACSHRHLLIEQHFDCVDCVEVFPGCWVVRTTRSTAEAATTLAKFIDNRDGVFVAMIGDSANWHVPNGPNPIRDREIRDLLEEPTEVQ